MGDTIGRTVAIVQTLLFIFKICANARKHIPMHSALFRHGFLPLRSILLLQSFHAPPTTAETLLHYQNWYVNLSLPRMETISLGLPFSFCSGFAGSLSSQSYNFKIPWFSQYARVAGSELFRIHTVLYLDSDRSSLLWSQGN
jgi:hypothetical protein